MAKLQSLRDSVKRKPEQTDCLPLKAHEKKSETPKTSKTARQKAPQKTQSSKGAGKAAAKSKAQGKSKQVAKKPSMSKAERMAMKKKLLKGVPKELVAKFSSGCAACRYAPLCTPSCWRKRGY